MEPIKVSRRDIERLVTATFPEYKGRKFSIRPKEKIQLSDLNWSGGTRSEYKACTLDGQWLGSTECYAQMWPGDNKAEGMIIPIPSGVCVIEHCIFCGKDLGIRIYVNPVDMTKLLPRT